MSNNASRNTTFAARRQEAAAAEWDLSDLEGLMEEVADETEYLQRAKRACEKALYRQGKRFISARGVEALVNDAKADFCEATGATLPWNLNCRSGGDFGGTGLNYGPGNLGRHGDWLLPNDADDVMSQWARFAGWLRVAKNQSALARMITKTQGHGQGAKATKFDLWDLQRRWNSPHRLERMVRAVRKRGNAILSAYEGQPNVSYKGIALGLLAERSVGKAAVVAVAVTLGVTGKYGPLNYRTARAALIELHVTYPVTRTDDDVTVRIGHEPSLVQDGIQVFSARIARAGCVSLNRKGFLVVRGERTYHVTARYSWDEGSAKDAITEAVDAWEKQGRYAAEKERLRLEAEARQKAEEERLTEMKSFLEGDFTGYCPLITRKDSKEAGNCSPGIEEWLLQRGWRRREWIPGVWLAPHLGDCRVARVVNAVMQRNNQVSKAA